jgi:hypothetical protein
MKYLSIQTFQCGISVSGAATFTGGATINLLALNGATTSSEASLFLGAHGTLEGGQLVLQKGTSQTYAAHLDNYSDQFRVMYGTNTGSTAVALAVSLATRQLILPAYTSDTSFSGSPAGYLAFDSAGNIITTSLTLSGYVPTSRTLTINGTTYDLSANRTWTISNVETDTLDSVTDRGNITTNTIDVGGVKSDYFLLDTTATPALSAGMMRWNDADGTAEIALKYGDVVLQLGQEQHYVVRNSTGSTIQNGTAVYASGVTAGSGRIEASPYIADGSIREVRFLGLATHDITNGVNGVVTHFGYVRDLDTRGTAVTAISVGDENWSVGDILYVHPTVHGKLTNVKPKHEITVAIVINRHQSSGVLFVRPSSAGHLDDIHDVILTSETNGQLLKYDSTAGAWVNWSPNYLTAEADTLATVTGRGATTNTSITVGPDLIVQADGSVNYTASRLWLNSHNNYRGAGVHMSGVGSTWFAGTPYTDFDGGYVIARTGTTNDVTSAQYSNALLTVKSSGNVGIGTTSPSYKLQVNADGAGLYVLGANTAPYTQTIASFVYGGNGNSINIENQGGKASIQARAGSSSMDLILNAAGSNVGIGTASPAYKLDVIGDVRASSYFVGGSSGQGFSWTNFTYGSYLDLDNSQNALRIRNSANTIMLEVNGGSNYFTGNLGIGTTSPSTKLHVVGSRILVQDGSNAGLMINTGGVNRYSLASTGGAFQIYDEVALTNRFYITTAGNIGIGTTSPSTLLDVNGVITATGGNSTNWNTAYGWGNHSSAGYVPQARTLTINGTSYDLSANRSWTIATTTPGGSNTQFQYNSSGTLAGASALTYNSANNRVGINQASPGYDLDVNGQVRVQDKLRVGTVNSGNGVVHMSSTATINPSATTIVWSQNVSVGMCAFIEYYILNNNTTTDQRAGTIMVTWNQSGTPTIAHTETTTPDIGSTTPVIFTSSLVGSDARINAVNASSAPYTIVMNYRYF